MDSATPGKPSVQNDMIGCCSGLVIDRREHDAPNLTLLTGTSPQGGGFPSLFETVVSVTPCRMTSSGNDRMEEETSSLEVYTKNHVK